MVEVFALAPASSSIRTAMEFRERVAANTAFAAACLAGADEPERKPGGGRAASSTDKMSAAWPCLAAISSILCSFDGGEAAQHVAQAGSPGCSRFCRSLQVRASCSRCRKSRNLAMACCRTSSPIHQVVSDMIWLRWSPRMWIQVRVAHFFSRRLCCAVRDGRRSCCGRERCWECNSHRASVVLHITPATATPGIARGRLEPVSALQQCRRR